MVAPQAQPNSSRSYPTGAAKEVLNTPFDEQLRLPPHEICAAFNIPDADVIQRMGDEFRETGNLAKFGMRGRNIVSILCNQARLGAWLNFEIGEENLARNNAMIGPTVVAAMAGDTSAREYYERSRVFHAHYLPKWADKLVHDLIKARVEGYLPGKKLDPFCQKFKAQIEQMRFQYDRQSSPAALGLALVQSYSAVQEAIASFDACSYEGPEAILVGGDAKGRTYQFKELYSPISCGRVGEHARDTLKMVSSLMMKALVLHDYLTAAQLDLPDDLKREVIRTTEHHWDIARSSIVENFRKLSDEFVTNPKCVEIKEPERWKYLRRVLYQGDPVAGFWRCLNGSRAFEAAPPNRDSTSQMPSQLPDRLDSYRENFILGVTAALEMHKQMVVDPSELREIAKRFFSLAKRGACSFMEIVRELEAGGDPTTMLARIYKARLKVQHEPAVGKVEKAGCTNSVIESELIDPEHIVKRVVMVRTIKLFDEWLNARSEDQEAVIRGRLIRVEHGNFGVHAPITDFKDLHELVIEYGRGYRLYYTFWNQRIEEAKKAILILMGGEKQDQARDIRTAHRRLLSWQSGSV